MITCCYGLDESNPYDPDVDKEKYTTWKTIDGRQRAITCISTLLCPLTCPVWTTCRCVWLGIGVSNFCCCSGVSCKSYYDNICRFSLCYPPYVNKCALLFCSACYPFHSCPDHCQELRTKNEAWACPYSTCFYIDSEPLTLADYATGPEREMMHWSDIRERHQRNDPRRVLSEAKSKAKKAREEASTPTAYATLEEGAFDNAAASSPFQEQNGSRTALLTQESETTEKMVFS